MTCGCLPCKLSTALGNRKKQEKVTVTVLFLGGISPGNGGGTPGRGQEMAFKAGHLSSPRLSFLTCQLDTTGSTSLDCCEVHMK